MRFILLTSFLFVYFSSLCQEVDSSWIANTYNEGFTRDTGTTLQEPNMIDVGGRRRSLTEFAGKVLYIEIWTTWCAACLGDFPRSAKLLERLRSIHADTAIEFITLCTEGSISKWKNLVKKHQREGSALYTTDTSIYEAWHIESFPTYILLDRSGKIIASPAPHPGDGLIDYILYAAGQNIKPADAIWIQFRQAQYFKKNNAFTNDAQGLGYAKWFYATNQIRFRHWQEQQTVTNGH